VWYWTYCVNVLQAVKGVAATPLNTGHFWSLCVEEQFYFVWPFVVLSVTRERLVHVAAWTIALGAAVRIALVLGPGASAAYVLTPGRLDGLMAGAVLAVAAREPGGLGRWRVVAGRTLAIGAAAVIVLAAWRGMEYSDPVIAIVGFPMLALGYASALVLALTTTGWWPRILRNATLRNWGKFSYGLYVLHYPILWVIHQKLGHALDSPSLVVAGSRLPSVGLRILIGVPLMYGAAVLSYQLYERRFLALKAYFV
jgi:peptidoglycan/LPS O-acetylase OafA/YrhL